MFKTFSKMLIRRFSFFNQSFFSRLQYSISNILPNALLCNLYSHIPFLSNTLSLVFNKNLK